MDDWLDALDNKDKEKESATRKPELRALADDEAPTQEFESVPAADSAEEETVTKPAPKKEKRRREKTRSIRTKRPKTQENSEASKRSSVLPVALGVGVLVVVAGGAMTFLAQGGSTGSQPGSDPQPVAEDAQVQGPQPVETTADKVAEVGQLCSGNNDVDVSNEDSPRSAIVKFEQAYFKADAQGVKDSLTKNSEMQNQDWNKILPDAAPKGTKFCLTMQPAQDSTTNVELEVKKPNDSNPTLYKQKVTAKEANGTWAVHSIGRED